MFTPSQGIAALEKIMTLAEAQVGVSEIANFNMLNSFFCQGRYTDELKTEAQEDGEKSQATESLLEDIKVAKSVAERLNRVQVYIRLVIKETLSLRTTDVLDLDQSFDDLGVDSLMTMELKNRLQITLGEKSLTMNSIEDNRTIRSLSAHINSLMDMQNHTGVSSLSPQQATGSRFVRLIPSL